MKFTDIFIKRPVFSTVLSILILLLGLVAYQRLGVRQYPKTDASVITIKTNYTGASASEIESYITQPIENAVSSIDNIDYLESTSQTSSSIVKIHLVLNADIDQAILDIQSALSTVKKKFPSDVDPPVISKHDSGSMPIMILSFSDVHKSHEELTDYLTRSVVPEISTVNGVSEAEVLGKRTYAIRIWLDANNMNTYQVTANDIKTAIKNNNLESQAGEIDRSSQVLSIRTNTNLTTPQEFQNLVVKTINSKPIYLSDVARISLGASDYTNSLYVNGKETVGIGISAKSDANPLEVAKLVKNRLHDIQNTLPAGMSASIARDSTVYIQQSITEANKAILESCLFVVLIIFVFLASLRSALIPIVTIPIALIGICTFMLLMGYTINTLTLLAWILGIGMIVDDAIVVLENIHRHIEAGMAPFQAAIKGAREIRFAIIAMTLTLTAVYAPLAFSTGLTGSLFKEFAFTLAGTIILSGIIALTLSPMMCSKIMRPTNKSSKIQQKLENALNNLTNHYKTLLTKIIHARFLTTGMMVTILCCGIIILIPLVSNKTLSPSEDQGMIIGSSTGPTASNIKYTEKYTKQLEEIFHNNSNIEKYTIINGAKGDQSSAQIMLSLKPWEKRNETANEIITNLTNKADKIPGLVTMFFSPSNLPGNNGLYPVQFIIKSNGSYQELAKVVNNFVIAAEKNPSIARLKTDLKLDKPELEININRSKTRDLGISMQDISNTLNIALGKPNISTFVKNGLGYNVITQLKSSGMDNPVKINNLSLRTANNQLVPMLNLIHIQNKVIPTQLNHFQQQRSATINIVLKPGYSTGTAINYLTNLARKQLPSNMSYDFSGSARQYKQENNTILQMFIYALIFIYLFLSAQFESFRYPLIVLLTVPLALAGALVALFFTHSSLNIYTEIGLITLIGLITKHGILIVEFARQLQEHQKYELYTAIIEAAKIRFRPIIMTTCAMLLGALPLIFATGAGAASRQQIGIVIFGGMLLGTLLSLFIIPVFYTILAKK